MSWTQQAAYRKKAKNAKRGNNRSVTSEQNGERQDKMLSLLQVLGHGDQAEGTSL